jgi:hypothetical protein
MVQGFTQPLIEMSTKGVVSMLGGNFTASCELIV